MRSFACMRKLLRMCLWLVVCVCHVCFGTWFGASVVARLGLSCSNKSTRLLQRTKALATVFGLAGSVCSVFARK